MKRGLFVNDPPAQCSLHEIGRTIHEILAPRFGLDYAEAQHPSQVKAGYDYYVVNYHYYTHGFLKKHALPGHPPCVGFHWEVDPGNPWTGDLRPGDFDAVCVCDPTQEPEPGVFPFPRPVPEYARAPRAPGPLRVGMHGLTIHHGKPVDLFIDPVANEFPDCEVRLHLAQPTYDAAAWGHQETFLNVVRGRLKPGMTLKVQRGYCDRKALLDWVAGNDLMVFHYTCPMGRLAAGPDQAVACGVPFSVASCPPLRHVLAYQQPYPRRTLREALEDRGPLERMRADWSADKFRDRFAEVLAYLGVKA